MSTQEQKVQAIMVEQLCKEDRTEQEDLELRALASMNQGLAQEVLAASQAILQAEDAKRESSC